MYTDYQKFGDYVLASMPEMPAPCDTFAFWHNLLWIGHWPSGYPSLFQQLFGSKRDDDIHWKRPSGMHGKYYSNAVLRRLALRPKTKLSHALGNGYASLIFRKSIRPVDVFMTELGRRHIPEDTNLRVHEVETGFTPPILLPHKKIATEHLEKFNRILVSFGLQISDNQLMFIRDALTRLIRQVISVEEQFLRLNPLYFLIEADNYGWGLACSLVGRHYQVPVYSIAHGLDCDPWVYDHSFASHPLVWGPWRANRFTHTSRYPFEAQTIGYDLNPPTKKKDIQGINKLLWIMRPYSLAKCYTPEFSPIDGLTTLKLILTACKNDRVTLRIKPHPSEDTSVYSNFIAKSFSDCATLHTEDLPSAISWADAIVGDESTATAEAISSGKPVALIRPKWGGFPFENYGLPTLNTTNDVLDFLKNTEPLHENSRRDLLNQLFGNYSENQEDRIRQILI